MSQFYFFTTPEQIAVQNSAQNFGPISEDSEQYDASSHQFRVTNIFSPLSNDINVPAVAVCDGTICVQLYENNTKASLILKPAAQPPFDGPAIKFFVYKGINPASLFDGDLIIENDHELANDLTRRIRRVWEQDTEQGDEQEDERVMRDMLGIYRNATYEAISEEALLFKDDAPIDNLFLYEDEIVLSKVKAGDVIGFFTPGGTVGI